MTKPPNQTKRRRRAVLEHALEIATRTDRIFVSVAEGLAGSAIAALSAARLPTSPRIATACQSSSRVGLVSAVPGEDWNPLASGARVRGESEPDSCARDDPSNDPEPGPGHSAGVEPLLTALGRIVVEHRDAGYATLDRDDRFWTLLQLLQTLGRPGDDCSPAPDDEPRT
jgi:hypothetical protein